MPYNDEINKTLQKMIKQGKIKVLSNNYRLSWVFEGPSQCETTGCIKFHKHTTISKNVCIYNGTIIVLTLEKSKFKNLVCKSFILNKTKLNKFCKKLVENSFNFPKTEQEIRVYYTIPLPHIPIEWRLLTTRPGRSLDSIYFDENIKENLIADITEFFSKKQWYLEHSIPYRRGYLLYGPPGCGKSSLITAICSELKLDIYLVPLATSRLSDNSLIRILNSVPKGQLILIEDLDSVLGSGYRSERSSKISLNGLLKALDGPVAHTDHIVVFSANDIRGLTENNLFRAGRIDYRVEVGFAEQKYIKEMFKNFYSTLKIDNIEDLADEYSQLISNKDFPMCFIQNHLISNKNNPKRAISHVKDTHRE